MRARTGHGHAPDSFSFKSGDALYGTFECRTVDTLLAFGNNGRIYTVAVSGLPGARGDGQPISAMIELEAGTHLLHFIAGAPQSTWLLSGSGGYGFLASIEHMSSRQRAGKAFITCNAGETICAPSRVSAADTPGQQLAEATHVACASTDGRLLTFAITDLRTMPNGGRGLMLMSLEDKASLVGAAAYARSIRVSGIGRGSKPREETLEIRSLNNAAGVRGRKGKDAGWTFKLQRIEKVQ